LTRNGERKGKGELGITRVLIDEISPKFIASNESRRPDDWHYEPTRIDSGERFQAESNDSPTLFSA
jgi:hypothetical protein